MKILRAGLTGADNTKYCGKVCHKSRRLSNMGVTALKKHMEVQAHKIVLLTF